MRLIGLLCQMVTHVPRLMGALTAEGLPALEEKSRPLENCMFSLPHLIVTHATTVGQLESHGFAQLHGQWKMKKKKRKKKKERNWVITSSLSQI